MKGVRAKLFLDEKLSLHQLQTLDSLIEVLIKPRWLKRDLFFALWLILMRENDFLQIKAPNEGIIDLVDYMSSTRKKNSDVYEATFLLNNYQDMPIKILASSVSDLIVLNAIILETCKSYAICVPINKFVVTSRLGIPYTFSHLKLLLKLFKDFLDPIKSCIFNMYNSNHGGLLALPEAVILQILLNLRIRDVLNLSESCKRMNCIVKADLVWYRLYIRDFPDAHKYDGRDWWLDIYSGMYVLSRKQYASNVQASQEYADYVTVCAESPKWQVIL